MHCIGRGDDKIKPNNLIKDLLFISDTCLKTRGPWATSLT